MIGPSAIAIAVIFVVFVEVALAFSAIEWIDNYIEKPDTNRLNVLPEYEVESHVCYDTLPSDPEYLANDHDKPEKSSGDTVIYRIPGGPKSPKAHGKRASLIQHGILCDVEPCTVNKLHIATVYLLVDQGYDVWLGLNNYSMLDNLISSNRVQKKKLEHMARCILKSTDQTQLLVMGYSDGNVQFFGMSVPDVAAEQSKLSKWLEYIPGVRTVKKMYHKAKNYLTRGYEKIVNGFDTLGRKIDIVINDTSVTNLKKAVLQAWGFVTTMIVPTLSVHDFSKIINHPDIHIDALQLITKYGYIAELHHVQTQDGYLLSVHRIAGSKKFPPRRGKPVVYLQHGILGSSAVWIVMGPSKSLAYILADEGYDVWMGNSRGNTYSRAHVNLSSEGNEFWDFSFHEMGVYDLPATIDHIIANTGEKKINYIGHSQGTASFFVMLSERPEYNDKIRRFVAYGPLIYATQVRSLLIRFFSKISPTLYRASQLVNIHEFLPTNALLTKIGRDVCETKTLYQVICSNAYFMVAGYDSEQIDKSLVPIILGHLPAGSSIKQLVHFGQEFNSKKFRNFDYSDASKNRAKYGTDEPPEYKISNVEIPVAIFYADNDWLADSRDAEKLGAELPNVELHKVAMELFNHADFMFAMDAPILVYYPTIEYLRKSIDETP